MDVKKIVCLIADDGEENIFSFHDGELWLKTESVNRMIFALSTLNAVGDMDEVEECIKTV